MGEEGINPQITQIYAEIRDRKIRAYCGKRFYSFFFFCVFCVICG